MIRNILLSRLIKNLFALFLFFLFFYTVIYFFSFLENTVKCFPATVITTEKEAVDKILVDIEVCEISVDIEKMTFDSAVFNHYEKLPVKDIYLYSIKIPFSKWSQIKNLEDSISETNPYIEEIVTTYVNSRIRYFSIAFVLIFLTGLVFLVKIAPSWRSTKKVFFITAYFTSITFIVFSVLGFFFFSGNLYPLIGISASILFAAYLTILIIVHRLMKTGGSK